MINKFKYTSADIIPAKLYFKILSSGDLSLLSSEKLSEKELLDIWTNIQQEDADNDPQSKSNKTAKIAAKIEALAAQQEFTEIAVFYLSKTHDEELIQQLKDYGFKFTGDLLQDLIVIVRENKALTTKIKRLQKRLPTNETNSNKTTFDENVLSYATITKQGFINTNEITLTQYRALIKIGNEKIKTLENVK